MVRVFVDALDRTHHDTLRLVEMADALGAAIRMDDVNRFALGDSLVRASRLAYIAVHAKLIDNECHGFTRKKTAQAQRGFFICRLLRFYKDKLCAGGFDRDFHALGFIGLANE